MRNEEFGAICLKRTMRQRERSFLNSATHNQNYPRLSSSSSGHKNALAEARARSEFRDLYWTADATLCSSVLFSVCLVKTM